MKVTVVVIHDRGVSVWRSEEDADAYLEKRMEDGEYGYVVRDVEVQ